MRVTVIVHEEDVPSVRGRVFTPNANYDLSPTLFPLDSHTFDVVIYSDKSSILTRTNNETLTIDEIADYSNTVVLIAGESALASDSLIELLRTFLSGQGTPSWSNEALVVLHFSDNMVDRLRSLPAERIFHLPGESDEPNNLLFSSMVQRHDVRNILDTIEENQTQNPNIGFGLLLLNQEGRFFLMQRLRQPGQYKYGNIGGSFNRGETISTQLDEILNKRFRKGRVPKIELGPLLACTSMQNGFYHYVDLTFLATTAGRTALGGVSDRGLQPIPTKMLGELPNDPNRYYTEDARYWFDIEEVAWFHSKGLLFRPVANAFEAFCRRALAYEAKNGMHDSLRVPSLFRSEAPLDIRWISRNGGMRTVMAGMSHWSGTALPFFEGSIQ